MPRAPAYARSDRPSSGRPQAAQIRSRRITTTLVILPLDILVVKQLRSHEHRRPSGRDHPTGHSADVRAHPAYSLPRRSTTGWSGRRCGHQREGRTGQSGVPGRGAAAAERVPRSERLFQAPAITSKSVRPAGSRREPTVWRAGGLPRRDVLHHPHLLGRPDPIYGAHRRHGLHGHVQVNGVVVRHELHNL